MKKICFLLFNIATGKESETYTKLRKEVLIQDKVISQSS